MPIRDFLSESHQLTAFAPFGGTYCRFDARMRATAGTLEISVKLFFDFGWVFFNTSGYSRERWLAKYMAQIAKYWDGRFRIVLKDANGREIKLTPMIRAIAVTRRQDAHFVANVQHLHIGRSYVSPGAYGQPHNCVLYSDSVKARPKGWMTKLGWKATLGGSREKLIVDEATRDLGGILQRRLEFGVGSATIASSHTVRLRSVESEFRQNMSLRPALRLLAVGYRVTGENAALSQQRAQAAAQALSSRGLGAHFITPIDGGIVRESTTTRGFVAFEVDPASAQTFMESPNNFPIAAHEFGHKLGNLDEYVDRNVDATLRGQFNRAAAEFGLPGILWDRNTTSLMSLGDKVMPQHYIPIALAVKQMREQFYGATFAQAKVDAKSVLNVDAGIRIDPHPQTGSGGTDEDLDLGALFG